MTSSSKKPPKSQAKSSAKPAENLSDVEDYVHGSGNEYDSDEDREVAAVKPARRSTDTSAKVVQKLQEDFNKESQMLAAKLKKLRAQYADLQKM